MTTLIWRTICALLVLILLAQNLVLLRSRYKVLDTTTSDHLTKSRPGLESPGKPTSTLPWKFDVSLDASNYGLAPSQCATAFPSLYADISRAVQHRASNPITQNDTDISWRSDATFRALIHNNTLRILSTRHLLANAAYRERALSVLHQLNRALIGASATGENLPTIEFAVTVDDRSLIPSAQGDSHAIWHFTRNFEDRAHDRVWLIPDFNFWAWHGVAGSYADMRSRASLRDSWILDKDPRAMWRGVAWTNPAVREPLLSHTRNQSWADVREIKWGESEGMMAMEDFCRYAFVVHTEGRSWSGRLKYLLNCDNVPVIHDLEWMTHYYHLLTASGPGQNYIPVRRDFSDLEDKVKYYLAHPEEAQKIANNAVATFRDRYLTPAAEACYWRELIRGWREASFEPDVWEHNAETGDKQVRGVTFEDFILTDEWPQLEEER